ncbi:GSCOCG00011716001-RA-CDS [Cotesia congregata]|nr:GSCOCG00011716001-RA-CDS [Cotesia congregata]
MNLSKMKAMIFGTVFKLVDLQHVPVPNIVINDTVIDYCKSVRYLGVVLEDTLTWSLQVSEICKKTMIILAQLKMNGKAFSFAVRKRLVTTLIFPVFDYCAAVYTDLTAQQQLRLQRKLNACVRYIFKLSRFEHVTRYYKELCWLTLSSRRTFFMSCLIYKALYLQQKPLISNNLQICEPRPRRGDERNDLLVVPGCHSTKYDKSFLVSAIRVWNRLPSYCTSQLTFPAFRKACFEFLLSEENARFDHNL